MPMHFQLGLKGSRYGHCIRQSACAHPSKALQWLLKELANTRDLQVLTREEDAL